MNRVVSLFVAAFILSTPSVAAPVVIGFEGAVSDTGVMIPATPYFEKGFTLAAGGMNPAANGIFGKGVSNINSNGSAIFGWCNEISVNCQPEFFLTHDNATFDFNSLDATNLTPFALGGAIPGGLAIVVTGYHADGPFVTQTLPIVQDTWQTYTLTGFTDLVWAKITTNIQGVSSEGDVAMDSLDLTFVPEPASLILMFGGLAGVAFRRRARRSC